MFGILNGSLLYGFQNADVEEENIPKHKMETIVYHMLTPMILKQRTMKITTHLNLRYTLLKLFVLPQSTKYYRLSKMSSEKTNFFLKKKF